MLIIRFKHFLSSAIFIENEKNAKLATIIQNCFRYGETSEEETRDRLRQSPAEERKIQDRSGGRYDQTSEDRSGTEEGLEESDNKTVGKGGNDMLFSTSAAPTFYSNAERAVEGIKQNKATAEQWLAMIKKSGGLKAGEDKRAPSNNR